MLAVAIPLFTFPVVAADATPDPCKAKTDCPVGESHQHQRELQ
jgi:hypothetical protein